MLRSIACDSLDRRGMAWIIAFESPSLSGLWPATDAGLVLFFALGSESLKMSNCWPQKNMVCCAYRHCGWFCIIPTMPQVLLFSISQLSCEVK